MNTTANINLKVPFAEKDQAKSLGARWNAELKVWYVPAGVDAVPFAKWITDGTSTAFVAATVSKKAAAKTGAKSSVNADNIAPQSLDGLTITSLDADMDAINAKLRDAFDTPEMDAY